MAGSWRPTNAEGLLSSITRLQRQQERERTAPLAPLVQDVVDASAFIDNIPPFDYPAPPDPDLTPVEEPPDDDSTLPDDIDSSSGHNVITGGDFEQGSPSGFPLGWTGVWDIAHPQPIFWDNVAWEAYRGAGRVLHVIESGWVHESSTVSDSAIPLVAGAVYYCGVRVKGTVTGGSYSVSFILVTGADPTSANLGAIGSQETTIGTLTDPGSQYTTIEAEVVIPPMHKYGRIVLQVDGTNSAQTGQVSWDEAEMVQKSEGQLPGGVPGYAHPRPGPFDAKEGLYNLTATSMTPGRLKVVATKGGRVTTILVVGSSTVAGFGAPGLASWPSLLLKELERDGCPILSEGASFVGMARSLALAGEPDSRWSFSGTVTQAAASLWATIANGSWAQFNSTRAGTAVRVHYFHTGGNFSVSIDGGAATAVTTNGSSTQAVYVASVASGTHTVRVTGTSATPAEIAAIEVHASGTGLRVVAAGVGGATSANFALNDFKNNLQVARTVNVPALTLISVGGNDCAIGVDLDQFRENITSTVRWSKFGASGVGLVVMPHANTYSLGQWAPYASALYDVADAENVPLLDMTYRWTNLETATASGLFGSSFVHPGPFGHADYAHAARELVY